MNEQDFINNYFKEQAAIAAYKASGVTESDLFVDNADSKHLSRKFASVVADTLNHYTGEVTELETLCRKIASTDDKHWTDVDTTIVNNVMVMYKTAMQKYANPVITLAAIPRVLSNIPLLATLALPTTAAVLGATGYLGERDIKEDDLKSEKIKAKIRRYKVQAARLNKSIKSKYGENENS